MIKVEKKAEERKDPSPQGVKEEQRK